MLSYKPWLVGAIVILTMGIALDVAASADRKQRDAQCLGLAMYWEARGEGAAGMLAVGSVVLNRVADTDFPDSVCGVVFQGGEQPPCQFSWWCDGKSDRPRNQRQWQAAVRLAEDLLKRRKQDPTRGALYFHSTSIRSKWHRQLRRTTRIGNHIFYR